MDTAEQARAKAEECERLAAEAPLQLIRGAYERLADEWRRRQGAETLDRAARWYRSNSETN